MARCTLDDLVPSLRCNRIFLEPFNGSYSEYQVKIDASVYDTVEDERGIANYLLTDTFKENILVLGVFSRDKSVKEFVDFLKINFPAPIQSYLFNITMVIAAFEGSTVEHVYETQQSNYSLFGISSIFRTNSFRNTFRRLFEKVKNSNFDIKIINFAHYTNELIENFGSIKLDPEGDMIYDLKIPKEDLSFTNNVSVEDCYFHCISYFNTSEATGLDIPIDLETISYFYNAIDECHILQSKKPASPNVQDFRLSERIGEIIRPDRISDYDNVIDEVSLISDSDNVHNSSIMSELYSSYVSMKSGDKPYTYNIFYLNVYEMCRRNSKLSFMYDNINVSTNQLEILNISVVRNRIDSPSTERHIIPSYNIIESQGKISQNIRQYSFRDISFSDLTYGKYRYTVEFEFIDPIYKILEQAIKVTKQFSSRLFSAINYIHNNPQSYNELRDELSQVAQADIRAILGTPQEMFIFSLGYGILFKMLTGVNFNDIQSEMASFLTGGVERRLLENMHRVVQDTISSANNFIEVDSINNSSSNAGSSTSKVVNCSRVWNTVVDATVFDKGMVSLIPRNTTSLTEGEFEDRMGYELEKHGYQLGSAEDVKNLGFVTPSSIDDSIIFSDDSREAFLRLFSNIFGKTGTSRKEEELSLSLLNSNPDGYVKTVSEIKGNSGIFESFLSTLGGTITNETLADINTQADIGRINNFSIGIDNGENISKSQKSGFGTLTRVSDEDAIDLEDQRAQIKQNLLIEKSKTEDITMRMLVDMQGYGLLDRKEYVQGDKKDRRFDYNFNFISNASGKPYPSLFHRTEKYFRLSENGSGDASLMAISRFIMDNTYMIFYLKGFDENMNPQWSQLVDFESVKQLVGGSNYTSNSVLCKFKRYQDSKMQIGQGSTSDREIMSRYFYLNVN